MVRERLTKLLTLRVAPSEADMLERLAETIGLPMSAVVRQLVRREYEARFGDEPVKRSRAKRK